MNQRELDGKLLKIFDCGCTYISDSGASKKAIDHSEKLIFQIVEAFESLTGERDALAEKLEFIRKSEFRMPVGGDDGFVSIDEFLKR